MQIRFNPNGGELGRARRITQPTEFYLAAPYVADILRAIYVDEFEKDPIAFRPACWAFEFSARDEPLIAQMMWHLSNSLPPNVKWYETDGKKLFAVRGPSGGVVSSLICYLITDHR